MMIIALKRWVLLHTKWYQWYLLCQNDLENGKIIRCIIITKVNFYDIYQHLRN